MLCKLLIGIAGGTGAGKTTLVKILQQQFSEQVVCLSHDSYYRDLSSLSLDERRQVNFDHPDSLETELMIKQLKELIKGQSIKVPIYDFNVSNRTDKTSLVKPKSVVIVEGILIFADPILSDLFQIKVFVDAPADVRLGRRIKRDIEERGRTLEHSLNQYLTMSRPMHEQYVEPSKKFADVIVPEGGKNTIATQMLINLIEKYLK
ncbi:uridine kinase [Candidatus Roizmanbacteria bacterium RIFOXYB2_FULL_41_10]|uniref:Uridine kinase n=1 Tax=Candidatus Roizmanbacteria bacterium RIFOXYA1_FULL_41_12 TaxID=1802082 RepID=A0A1F7KEY9_9BACT|nr:MAG: uridine kinase [Candidatus Roizmanbacteria bacterium RIFOXYA1_FULL_41_12]OGK68145.1 MAG: uridine kinase [Candidatus Roizmanbacteria bacterium RIFOXYB1_FULL_41_27]OGK68571.1 MAG: uridine kinase [Candidatus Roizmanbacteria bacterium RIFOXYA2_FULL_41_8]OGK69403.1 MAG: uridine kinase [Candidatus Roizmanbacteria bacterium RIFOXYB2_FULL_41_10]OGK71931.1 MAG: uridine kinase [Candidatus Roizmanbacteria bacterium RIFOXYC1_FULL_41_16]OGK75338.1 MAG: uridine kinase [Candidatus Roizmanbacteria bac